MSIVTLVSGGLDSTLMAILAKEEQITQFPLFLDYGQLSRKRELDACLKNFERHGLPTPRIAQLDGFGALLSSGLTDSHKRVFEDAFLPCRNLLFLTVGAGYAYQCGADAVAIGLLNDSTSIFGDQTSEFVQRAESLISMCLGVSMRVVTPLMEFSKADVVRAAKLKGISGTYSCHSGMAEPCGVCVACREFMNLEV